MVVCWLVVFALFFGCFCLFVGWFVVWFGSLGVVGLFLFVCCFVFFGLFFGCLLFLFVVGLSLNCDTRFVQVLQILKMFLYGFVWLCFWVIFHQSKALVNGLLRKSSFSFSRLLELLEGPVCSGALSFISASIRRRCEKTFLVLL